MSDHLTAEELDARASLASALLAFQEDRLSNELIAAHISSYGLCVTFSVTETGLFQASLLHIDGGRLDSGLCTSPEEARDLVLGIKYLGGQP